MFWFYTSNKISTHSLGSRNIKWTHSSPHPIGRSQWCSLSEPPVSPEQSHGGLGGAVYAQPLVGKRKANGNWIQTIPVIFFFFFCTRGQLFTTLLDLKIKIPDVPWGSLSRALSVAERLSYHALYIFLCKTASDILTQCIQKNL